MKGRKGMANGTCDICGIRPAVVRARVASRGKTKNLELCVWSCVRSTIVAPATRAEIHDGDYVEAHENAARKKVVFRQLAKPESAENVTLSGSQKWQNAYHGKDRTMSIRSLMPWHRRSNTYVSDAVAGTRRDPLQSLHEEVDRLFDNVFQFGGAGPQWLGNRSDIWPKIDIADEEKAVRVVADLPGIEQKDIDLSIDDGVLTLKGEKSGEVENKDAQFSERFYGRFERRIPVGYELDEDKIDAKFENGVLTVTLPKSENAQSRPKHITIRT